MKVVVLAGALEEIILCLLLALGPVGNVVDEVALEVALVFEEEFPGAIFEVLGETSREGGPVGECLLAGPFLDPVLPLAPVHPLEGAVGVLAIALGQVIPPLALVVAAVEVDHVAEAAPGVVLPHAYVVQATVIEHDTVAGPDFDVVLAEEVSLVDDFGGEGLLDVGVGLGEGVLYLRIALPYFLVLLKEKVLHVLG